MSFNQVDPRRMLFNPGPEITCKCGTTYYDATGMYGMCEDCYAKKSKEVKVKETVVKTMSSKESVSRYLLENSYWGSYFKKWEAEGKFNVFVDKLFDTFSHVDILKKLKELDLYLFRNPKRKYSSWDRFICNNLDRGY